MTKTKIIIAGIGAVGGYFGGLLAKHYYDSQDVDIIFLARGNHLKEIQKNGLKIRKGASEFIAKPRIATDNSGEIGIADFIILCTKNYDLEDTLIQLQPCISQNTIILPLLNGVDSKQLINNIYPHNLALEGCVYIVSRLKQAGLIENSGNIQKVFFGLEGYYDEKLQYLEHLFKEAEIEATYSQTISTIIWEKFILISSMATATCYFDKSIGEILLDKNCTEALVNLIEELKQIAKAKQISISANITEITMNLAKSFPFGSTSSMHSDYINKKPKTELQSLTKYVIDEGIRNNMATPTYSMMYEKLKTLHS